MIVCVNNTVVLHNGYYYVSGALGGLNGYNIPMIQACPEVGEYLDMPPAELANQVPRDMKGVAKRLFCDAYMYLYKNDALTMYM